MLSTCYHCHAKLGTNDALEALPIGRRIAYDGERGRVWVICAKCARWNLTPFEERWEALEQAERLYRGTRARVSTDNIALAKLADGTELVRIGRPLRPEFAAWRFGSELRRRSRKLWRSPLGVSTTAFSAVATVYAVYSLSIATRVITYSPLHVLTAMGVVSGAQWSAVSAMRRRAFRDLRTVRSIVPSDSGEILALTAGAMRRSRVAFGVDGGFSVHVDARAPRAGRGRARRLAGPVQVDPGEPSRQVTLSGDAAVNMLRSSLAVIHEDGATRGQIREMLELTERLDPSDALELLRPLASKYRSHAKTGFELSLLDHPRRLAVEMMLADVDERRLLQGDLAALYARWQDAEHVADIADRLLSDPEVGS